MKSSGTSVHPGDATYVLFDQQGESVFVVHCLAHTIFGKGHDNRAIPASKFGSARKAVA